MWRLYDLVARHFIATWSHDARFLQTKVTLSAGDEGFTLSGKIMIDPGYLAITLASKVRTSLTLFPSIQSCNDMLCALSLSCTILLAPLIYVYIQDETRIPDFREGEVLPFASLTLRDGQTSPPG